MGLFGKPYDKSRKVLEKLRTEKFGLQEDYNESESDELKAKIDELTKKIDLFIEETYAKEIYDYYKSKKPKLVRIKNGQIESWEDVFGDSYEALSKAQLHVLIGLVEGDGKYKLK